MGQESNPSPRSTKSLKPGPFAIAHAAATKEQLDTGSADLIPFNPTPAVADDQPASKTEASFLVPPWVFGLVVALGALALVLIFGPGLYRGFKAWRAAQLALQGEELVREKKFTEAIPTIRSAFMLSPDTPEVLRAMAQILTTFNVPGAMTYWNWLLQTKSVTNDDRRAAIDCAMQLGLYNEASTLIQDLLARDGKDARNQLIAASWCAQRGTPAQTMFYATRAVNDDPTYKPAILFLAVQELTNTYLYQDGVNSLFQLADSSDDSGLMALRHLALDPSLKPAEIDRLIARLHSHPLAGEPERIAALSLQINRHPDQRTRLIDEAVALHQKAAPADLAAFVEWLNSHGEAARSLKLIPRERALSNKDLFASYIDALGALNRWTDLKALLTGATVPLEAPFVELYLSRCATRTGDDQGSDLHWQNAVAAAVDNPAQSLYLAVYAEKLGQNERAAAVYRALTEDPITARIAYLGLLRVLKDKDTRTLCNLLEGMVSRWPKDDDMATQYVFLNLLLNEHVREMQQRAVSIMADDSYSLFHRSNVALACLRLNDPAGAFAAYSHASVDWNAAPVNDRVVYAATLHANGHTKAAHQLLSPVNRHTLRPELRDLIKSIP